MSTFLITACGYWIQILPGTLLLVLLFRSHLKLSGLPLILTLLALILIPGLLFARHSLMFIASMADMPTDQIRFLCFAFYMIINYLCLIPLFDESLSRKLFFFGIVANYAQIISTLSMIVERCFLPHATEAAKASASFFSLTNTVISLWLLVFTFPFIFYVLTKRFTLVLDAVSDKVWSGLAFSSVIYFAMLSISGLLLPTGPLTAYEIAVEAFIILGTVLLYSHIYIILNSAAREKAQALSEKQARFLLDLQLQRMKSLRQSIGDVRRNRHDLRHHFNTLSALAGDEDEATAELRLNRIKEYLDTYTESIRQRDFIPLCPNLTLDGLLNYHRSAALDHGIAFTCRADIPESGVIPDPVLCIIIGNLLENALDGAKTTKGPAQISFNGRIIGNNLIITVDNSFDGVVEMKGKHYLSTKHQGTGLGLSNVERFATSHGGHLSISHDAHAFHTSVLLPLVQTR